MNGTTYCFFRLMLLLFCKRERKKNAILTNKNMADFCIYANQVLHGICLVLQYNEVNEMRNQRGIYILGRRFGNRYRWLLRHVQIKYIQNLIERERKMESINKPPYFSCILHKYSHAQQTNFFLNYLMNCRGKKSQSHKKYELKKILYPHLMKYIQFQFSFCALVCVRRRCCRQFSTLGSSRKEKKQCNSIVIRYFFRWFQTVANCQD